VSLRDQMADDLAGVMDTDEFALAATYTPSESSATTFTATVIPQDMEVELAEGIDERYYARTQIFHGVRSTLRAAIATAISGSARDPARRDQLTFGSGDAYEGAWRILRVDVDEGDSAVMVCALPHSQHVRASTE